MKNLVGLLRENHLSFFEILVGIFENLVGIFENLVGLL